MGRQGLINRKCEILSPAGDFEAVKAAVLNGADAVYLGQKAFSARQSAENFSADELKAAVEYCHARDVRVYQTLNTLIFDYQINELKETIKTACESGVDALIVQDMGVAAIAQALCPTMPLHGSTQMSVHTAQGVKLLEELGFSRVVLAREMSRDEIAEAIKGRGIETEVFVHGALCMSVSGQCYISGIIGGRSGNRGACAGSCRLPFTTKDKVATGDEHALSLKDLCLADYVGELAEMGVTSLKIEGRMKRPEYVAAATRSYCDAFDGKEYDLDKLRAIFSRNGFTDGYYTAAREEMFGARGKEDVTSATSALLRELGNSYKKEVGKIPIKIDFQLNADNALLTITDGDGNSASAYAKPEIAINRETTRDDAEKAFTKLGGTIFFLDSMESRLVSGLSLKAAQMNEMRRSCCDELYRLRAAIKHSEYNDGNMPKLTAKKPSPLSLWGGFRRFSQLNEKIINSLERIILPLDEIIENLDFLKDYQQKLIIAPDRAMFGREKDIEAKLKRLKSLGVDSLIAENVAHIGLGKGLGFQLVGGQFLNCTNSYSVMEYQSLGISAQTVSFETLLEHGNAIKSSIPLGLVVYGRLPVMLLRSCPIKAAVGCKNCSGGITDRLGKRFEALCNDKRSVEIVNCNTLYMGDRLNELSNFSFGKLWFTTEAPSEISEIIAAYKNGDSPQGEFTRGLYYRKI